jgi:hypothetical protein
MTSNTVSILLEIPIALATGGYVTIVYSRYAKFLELRTETLRIIRSIDFMPEDEGLHITNDSEVKNLILISSDLISLGHSKAANIVNEVYSYINEISRHAKASRLDADAFNINYKTWQQMIRTMPPNRFYLWLW